MTELGGGRAGGADDDRPVDHFLVDGVAPAVIGDQPVAAPDVVHGGVSHDGVPHDPPTAPIPVAGQRAEPERRGWLARVFRRA
jgi:hypothetical protein